MELVRWSPPIVLHAVAAALAPLSGRGATGVVGQEAPEPRQDEPAAAATEEGLSGPRPRPPAGPGTFDLSPVLADRPGLAEVTRLVDEDLHREALARWQALEEDEEDVPMAVRHAVGLAGVAARSLDAAERHLGAVVEDGGPLADLAAWRLGEALRERRPDAARRAFAAVSAGTPLSSKARLEEAALALADDDVLAALQALDDFDPALGNRGNHARWLVLKARAQRAGGLTWGARQTVEELLAAHPRSDYAREEAERLSLRRRLYHWVDGVMRRRNAGRYRRVILDVLRGLDRRDRALWRWHVWYALGWADSLRGSREVAEERFTDVIRETHDPELKARAYAGRAVTLRRRNRDIEAAADYAAAARTWPRWRGAAKALDEAIFLTHLRARDDLALRYADTLLQDFPDSPERRDALWRKGWIRYRWGEHEGAIAAWDELVAEFPDGFGWSHGGLAERVTYWKARAWYGLGEADRAIALWRRILETHPRSYYGHLSFDRLSEVAPGVAARVRRRTDLGGWPKTQPQPSETWPLPAHEALRPVAELHRHGLRHEAWRLMRWMMWRGLLPDETLDFASVLALETEGVHRSHRVLLKEARFATDPEEGSLDRWHLAFPVVYAEPVRRWGEARELDPFLVLGVMRHESGFNPRAVSRSKAAGLMQLILPTARIVAGNLLDQRRPRRVEELFVPELNLQLGTRFLRYLLDRVDGNVALAVAGYNAGAGAIRTWRNRWGRLDTDEFVEELPYRETHGYTKQVLQAWGTYRYLYGPPGDPAYRRLPLPRKARPGSGLAADGA